jgi:predicted site-specific integrase-resolvase
MTLTLAAAAQRVGIHRSNLLRAVKAGRLSGTRDETGAWLVDESELVRVYPEIRTASHQSAQSAQADALLKLQLEHAQERIADLTRQLEKAERRLEAAERDLLDWKEQAKRVALPAPVQPAERQADLTRSIEKAESRFEEAMRDLRDRKRQAPEPPLQPPLGRLASRAWRWLKNN